MWHNTCSCMTLCACSCLIARTGSMAADQETYIKKDFMVKRSMMKSWLIKKENYKGRWFLLKRHFLCYYDGTLQVVFLAYITLCAKYDICCHTLLRVKRTYSVVLHVGP